MIPKATYAQYGVDEDVATFQAPTILIVHAKTPADVIYKVTKAVVEGREDFARVTAAMKGVSAKDMAQNHGMPMHPGAEQLLPGSRPAEVAAAACASSPATRPLVVGVVGVVMSLYHVYARLTPAAPDTLVLR